MEKYIYDFMPTSEYAVCVVENMAEKIGNFSHKIMRHLNDGEQQEKEKRNTKIVNKSFNFQKF